MLPLIALLARAEELPTQEPEIVEVSYVSKLHGTLRGSISASSSSTASVKMVPSVTWVKHPSGDVASFREHSLSLWGKMEAPSGSGSWSVDAPLEGLSGGLSYSLFVKEAGNEYVASSDLNALAQAADACRKACDAQAADDSAWCADEKNKAALKDGALMGIGTICKAGKSELAAIASKQKSLHVLPDILAFAVDVGVAPVTRAWVESTSGTVTSQERQYVPIVAELRLMKSVALESKMNGLVGLTAHFETKAEDADEAAQLCIAQGTLTDDDGVTSDVASCTESPFGPPTESTELSLKAALGLMPDRYPRWRATFYPYATIDLADMAGVPFTAFGADLLFHADLSRANPATYNGSYKGIIAAGPFIAWSPGEDGVGFPTIGLKAQVLAQTNLIDPSVGL